jgi:hypothetical protein
MKSMNQKISNKNRYFAYRSFWPEIEAMKKFRECGINTFSFMVSNTVNSLGFPYTKYRPVWKWNNIYDLGAFDQQIGDILEAIPDAKLMCMIDLNTPHWWTRYLGAFGVKYDSFYELGKISGSRTWRQDTAEYMQTLLQHAEDKYSGNIVAYILGGGGATEWHDRSRGEESIYRGMAYKQWLIDNEKTPTGIPGQIARDSGAYDFNNTYKTAASYYNGIDPTGCYDKLFPNGVGLLRTPEKNQDALDYWRFCNEFNADTVDFFLKKARKIIRPEAETGIFFGYSGGYWTMVSSGHLAYEKLLGSPELDFVMAPVDYMGRGMGRGTTSMTVKETIRLNGKQMLQEMDQRTYTCNRKLNDYCELPDPLQNIAEETEWEDTTDSKEQAKKFSLASDGVWKNDDEIIAGMKRDTAFCLINQDSLWWFDMWGGFYQGERVFSTLKQLKDIWDEQSKYPAEDISEILLVKDPENMYLLNEMDPRCGLFHSNPLDALSSIGMPYTVCSFNDLEQLDIERFKLIIFCHPFELTERHNKILDRQILKRQRNILWFYGPGIVKAGKLNLDNVKSVCGTSFGAPGINKVNMGDWHSIYIHNPDELTPEIMRELAKESGCHSYCPEPRPICANERLISVHTAIAENLKISLPKRFRKVTELFSSKTWRNIDHLELKSKAPDSFLLLLEN